jgi:hypothetical protein
MLACSSAGSVSVDVGAEGDASGDAAVRGDAADAGDVTAGDGKQEIVPCTSHEQCIAHYVDLGPCRLALCDSAAGLCMVEDMKDGTHCDDGLACTKLSYCSQGTCGGGAPEACDDGNPCTQDSCDEQAGCVFAPVDGGDCDDGNPCTAQSKCKQSACVGGPNDCACDTDADCALNDDSNPCNGVLACVAKQCVPAPGSEVMCPPPSGPCVTSVCNPGSGLCESHAVDNGTPCDDGNPCTQGDVCDGGTCLQGNKYVCVACGSDEDCAYLSEGDLCAPPYVCTDAKCHPGTEGGAQCKPGPCTLSTCNPETGKCEDAALWDGTFCDDGDACTGKDRCQDGACVGTALDCDDGNPCSKDGCAKESGCVHEAVTGAVCDDGDACTKTDTCKDGACVGQDALDCDDQDDCTLDACDPASGCMHSLQTNTPCDDGDPCTAPDLCLAGACVSGAPSCQCQQTADCAPYEDFNLCDGTLICQGNLCIEDPATQIACDPSLDSPCMTNTCNPFTGKCFLKDNPYGSECSDGNECTLGDACFFGQCQGGIPKPCDDGNPCSEDTCDPALGCVSEPATGGPCDDGFLCTSGDTCKAGQCIGGTNSCPCAVDADCAFFEDEDLCNGTLHCSGGFCVFEPGSVVACEVGQSQCSNTACDPATGDCVGVDEPAGTPCSDQSACTAGDSCFAGQCVGQPVPCEDGNVCTQDSCDPATGCLHVKTSGGACDDGNSCTLKDSCVDGACEGHDNQCPCEKDADCAKFEDADLCNGTLHCTAGFCETDPATIVKCDTSLDAPCKKALCDPGSGTCELAVFPDGMACDDGQGCTEGDVCMNGECTGYFKPCNDGNPCTDDACDPAIADCAWLPNTKPCDDGNPCTEADGCSLGKCVGKMVSCDDGNPCTIDYCASKGGCAHVPAQVACDDGNACTIGDACQDAECKGKTNPCDDGNPCTADACDPVIGCVHYAAELPCDDGDPCTTGDVCVKGECAGGKPLDCGDGNPCTQDACEMGSCQHEELDGAPCQDDLACTVLETCDEDQCVTSPNPCDDQNSCTTDSCAEPAGCKHAESTGPCEDGNPCTEGDSCTGGKCQPGNPSTCDDGNPCTTDSCDKTLGCQHVPTSLATCSDGNPCTTGDKCVNGKCAGDAQLSCDDKNPCTKDLCNPTLGCIHESLDGVACTDSNVCTESDKCVDGKCVGSTKTCTDTNPCTQDLCDPVQGCFFPPVPDAPAVTCNDGSACTQTDTCVGGKCTGANPKTCDDSKVCTSDSCNPITGMCKYDPLSGGSCSDGDPCTTGDTCVTGSCKGGGTLSCNDNNVCTNDSCVTAQGGCVYVPNTASCNDNNTCTSGDKCQNGQCVPGAWTCACGPAQPCVDDNNKCNGIPECVNNACQTKPGTVIQCPSDPVDKPCLRYQCQPASGACDLVPAPVTTLCNDNSACTTDDHCGTDGTCTGTAKVCNDNNVCTTDTCNAATGCVFTNNTVACDDGNPCTVSDKCAAGACAGSVYPCNDNNPCTSDVCSPENNQPKCFFSPVAGACNDNNQCTVGDACVAGTCTGSALGCGDGNPCTDDSCDPTSGCVHTPNTASCDDGNLCTESDKCSGGACAGKAKNCEDGNVCTDNYCDTASGLCKQTFNTKACNDGQPCTQSDVCAGGVCSGVPKDCSDGKICTDDACDPTTGLCSNPFNTKACDDGESCTSGDVCNMGVCAGAPVFNCCHSDADCDDKYACSDDLCVGGFCLNTAPKCDDGLGCTADFCGGGTCKAAPISTPVLLALWGFELGGNGWLYRVNPPSGSPDIFWSISDHRSSAGKQSLYVGNPKDFTYDHGIGDATAYSPPVRIVAGVTNQLSFKYYADVAEQDCNYDFLEIQVEAEDGTLSTLVPRLCSSTGGAFVPAAFDISAFGGKSVRFRFNFRTVDAMYNQAEGIYLDEIAVTAGPKAGCCQFDGDCNDGPLCTLDQCLSYECKYSATGGSYFSEDFDTGSIPLDTGDSSKWYIYAAPVSNPDVTWQVDNKRSSSTPYSLYAGYLKSHSYAGTSSTVWARTPVIPIPLYSTPVLTFSYWTGLAENGCGDFFEVRVATSLADSGTQIYKECGSTGGFKNASVALSGYKGQQVYLVFGFSSNAVQNNAEGVYVDNIRIVDSANPLSCCEGVKGCSDGVSCTIDTCDGVPGGGVCLHRPATNKLETFDDGVADGWSFSTNNAGVTWKVDSYRYVSKPNSLYCGNTFLRSYLANTSSGVVVASTPYVEIDAIPDLTPVVSYQRYIDILPDSKNCLTVTAKSSDMLGEVQLAKVCGSDLPGKAWLSAQHDLSAYKGKNVRISFTLNFPSVFLPPSPLPEGVYIDDVRIGFEKCQ